MQYHEHVFLYRVLAARTSDGKIGFSLLFARRQPQSAIQQPQCARRPRTFGTNCKNPPKITFEKFVKLSGHTCVCNNLTSFECEVYKNRKRKLLWKNWWNHIKWTYFWRILPLWNHSASPSLLLLASPLRVDDFILLYYVEQTSRLKLRQGSWKKNV